MPRLNGLSNLGVFGCCAATVMELLTRRIEVDCDVFHGVGWEYCRSGGF